MLFFLSVHLREVVCLAFALEQKRQQKEWNWSDFQSEKKRENKRVKKRTTSSDQARPEQLLITVPRQWQRIVNWALVLLLLVSFYFSFFSFKFWWTLDEKVLRWERKRKSNKITAIWLPEAAAAAVAAVFSLADSCWLLLFLLLLFLLACLSVCLSTFSLFSLSVCLY